MTDVLSSDRDTGPVELFRWSAAAVEGVGDGVHVGELTALDGEDSGQPDRCLQTADVAVVGGAEDEPQAVGGDAQGRAAGVDPADRSKCGRREPAVGLRGQHVVGGACRTATGMQWARMMTILGAMQGWGRPGCNFGNLQFGAPMDFNFYFPGYGEGSFSGEMMASANTANNYQRMPHIVTMSSVRQSIPRMWFPEAITQGKACLLYTSDAADE